MPERVQRWLERSWYGRAHAWLAPLSLLFEAFVMLRRGAYRLGFLASEHPGVPAGVPIIVVGNLTVGGTGKTPLVIWLAQQLTQRGINVGIALRGHGASAASPRLVNANSDAREVGDEAVLIARRTQCRVAIGSRRIEAARLLVSQKCDAVICDDGLQHLALRRDMEIVVIDGARGWGNGMLLPQGPLRERPSRLRTVDLVVINGHDKTGIASTIASSMVMDLSVEQLCRVATDEAVPLATLRGALVHAVAGIGNPGRFFALLAELGCQVREHAFADHHPFVNADLAFGDDLPIVMTEKDAVKCRAFAPASAYYLQVSARLPEANAASLLERAQHCISNGEPLHA